MGFTGSIGSNTVTAANDDVHSILVPALNSTGEVVVVMSMLFTRSSVLQTSTCFLHSDGSVDAKVVFSNASSSAVLGQAAEPPSFNAVASSAVRCWFPAVRTRSLRLYLQSI